jgi:hypothetical protein
MQNPKEFKATPFDHFKPTAHSGPEPKVNPAEKKHNMKATPWSHSAPTKKSGHEGMGAPRGVSKKEMKSSPVGAGMPAVICHSGKDGMGAPRAPKKFKHTGKDEL